MAMRESEPKTIHYGDKREGIKKSRDEIINSGTANNVNATKEARACFIASAAGEIPHFCATATCRSVRAAD